MNAASLFLSCVIAISTTSTSPEEGNSVEATYTPVMLTVDGRLDEDVWQVAREYRFTHSLDKESAMPKEGTTMQLAWHEQGLYIGFRAEDSAIIQQNQKDEQLHYRYGDVLEVFLKAGDDNYYWEMYATPAGNKTTLFFLRSSKGKVFFDPLTGHDFRDLQVGVQVQGTLNDSSDVDEGWTAEFFIPRSYMLAQGGSWSPDAEWSFFAARYNYGHDLKQPVLTMYPALSRESFHLTGEYIPLRLLPQE